MSYSQRGRLSLNPIGRRLFSLMDEKQTNLVLSLDVTTVKEVLFFADLLGPTIAVLKTHVDILKDFSKEFIYSLQELAEKHRFLIFEDRKFADIGNTSRLQYEGGIYEIASWAHIINAHILPGPGIIDGLKAAGLSKGAALLLIGQMSSKGSLATGAYTQEAVELAEKNLDFVIGFISQERLSSEASLLHMTPGISLEKKGDSLGQQYITPEEAIVRRGSDLIIVGRSILESKTPLETAKLYQAAAWKAYQQII